MNKTVKHRQGAVIKTSTNFYSHLFCVSLEVVTLLSRFFLDVIMVG